MTVKFDRLEDTKVIKRDIAAMRKEGSTLAEMEQHFLDNYRNHPLDRLITAFELLIPDHDRQLNGAFFTPPDIASEIARRAISKDTETICEPAMGCGAILVACVRRLAKLHGETFAHVTNNRIYGVDIADYNVRRAKIVLERLAGESVSPTLVCANSLDHSFDNRHFDSVAGNPPYVRFQHLPTQVRIDLRKWETIEGGNFNLYIPFFELGYDLLETYGKLVYITPNSFFTLNSTAKFREWASERKFFSEIIDHGDQRQFDVSAYTCISVGTQEPNTHLSYKLGAHKARRISYTELGREKWNLTTNEAHKRITRQGTPLGSQVTIRGGIATLRDRIYTQAAQDVEPELTMPLVHVSKLTTQDDYPQKIRIIYPYHQDTHTLISEEELQRYPETYKYLLSVKDELGRRDKGNKQYAEWYAYGRTQGLIPSGPCLYCPVYVKEPRFILGGKHDELFCNGLALLLKDEATMTLEEIQERLHGSSELREYMSALGQNIAGGYSHYRPQLLKEFRL